VYVLDSLSSYQPQDSSETENISERVIACLSHNNSGVVLSCIKVVMKYLDFISSPEVVRSYCRKITAPLVTMLGAEYEI
jgi:vesicle coat complex subunit